MIAARGVPRGFRVLIEGRGLVLSAAAVKLGTPQEQLAGFFTTRVLRARSQSEARDLALAEVRREWSDGKYAMLEADPQLVVAELEPLSWFAVLRARSTGCAFYSKEEAHAG
jgi:hypothetical protein